jgi:hypothetical protein
VAQVPKAEYAVRLVWIEFGLELSAETVRMNSFGTGGGAKSGLRCVLRRLAESFLRSLSVSGKIVMALGRRFGCNDGA